MKRTLTLLLLCLPLLLTPVHAGAAATVQPGDAIYTSAGQCTLGFLVDGDGGPYFLTAAHCVEKNHEQVRLGSSNGPVVGTVAALGNPNASATDWALIRVEPTRVNQISAVVRGHTAPTGVAYESQTNTGDVLEHSGHGIPWSVAAPLRERRIGILAGDDEDEWWSVGLDTFGDSGGPVIHSRTGRGLGLVSRLCLGGCTSEGPTVAGIIPQAAAVGYQITLRTF